MSNKLSITTLCCALLSRVYGPAISENLLGDMQEEYSTRRQSSPVAARLWMLSQYSRTLSLGLWRQCGTPVGLSRIVFITTLVVLPLVVGLVAWLSHMDETTPQLWDMVLAGEMHKALFVAEYWRVQPDALSRIHDLGMFVNYNSVLWVGVAMALVVYMGNKNQDSLALATLIGLVLMVGPYALSIVYLDIAQLPPQKIGPIIAFTLFNVFYMLPLMAFWLNRQAKQAVDTVYE